MKFVFHSHQDPVRPQQLQRSRRRPCRAKRSSSSPPENPCARQPLDRLIDMLTSRASARAVRQDPAQPGAPPCP
ncbi:MAG: hypothetical protein ACLSTO_06120 [Bilophila wadsworthia]